MTLIVRSSPTCSQRAFQVGFVTFSNKRVSLSSLYRQVTGSLRKNRGVRDLNSRGSTRSPKPYAEPYNASFRASNVLNLMEAVSICGDMEESLAGLCIEEETVYCEGVVNDLDTERVACARISLELRSGHPVYAPMG